SLVPRKNHSDEHGEGTDVIAYQPIRGRRIKFGLAGCGRISRNHIDAIRAHSERAELVAVCDTDHCALEAAAEATGVQGYSSLDSLLAESDADVIVLATPSGLHPEQA